jgi:hypothetical protein
MLRTKFNERKKVAWKRSENNGHWKVMVDGKGLSLKDTRKEEGGELWFMWNTGSRATVIFSSLSSWAEYTKK